MVDPWFTEQTAGFVGGGLGAGIGTVFGGILGPLVGVCAPRGRCKPLVIGLMVTGLVLGGGLLATGGAALAGGQPWYVWFAFASSGGLLALLMATLLPVVLGRYREAEQRRIAAEELRRG